MDPLESSAAEVERDEELFVRLLAQNENDIYRYVLSLVFNPSAVDDIIQEVAVALWKKFDQYDPERPFVPWACRFAYFQVLKHRSKIGKSRLVFSDKLVDMLSEDFEDEQELLVARRRALEGCVGALSSDDRELVNLRYNSTSTVQELAKVRKTTTHKLYHALERIRGSLLVCAQNAMKREGYGELA